MLVVDRCQLALAVGIVINTLIALKNRPFIRYNNVCLQYPGVEVKMYVYFFLMLLSVWKPCDGLATCPECKLPNHSWDSSATLYRISDE